MLDTWQSWIAEWNDRHVALSVVLRGVLSGVLFAGFMRIAPGDYASSPAQLLVLGCFFGVVMALFFAWLARRTGRMFPPGLDLDTRVAVRRIVRTGGAVTDRRLAPAVEHHARALLALPSSRYSTA